MDIYNYIQSQYEEGNSDDDIKLLLVKKGYTPNSAQYLVENTLKIRSQKKPNSKLMLKFGLSALLILIVLLGSTLFNKFSENRDLLSEDRLSEVSPTQLDIKGEDEFSDTIATKNEQIAAKAQESTEEQQTVNPQKTTPTICGNINQKCCTGGDKCDLGLECKETKVGYTVIASQCVKQAESIKVTSCISDAWSCDPFGQCSQSGQQTRTCTLIDNKCLEPNSVQPVTTQSCNPPIVVKLAVCDNGIIEEGETQQTCCQDTGCNEGFSCQSNGQCVCSPSEEVCDGRDNNCNNLIDDGITCQCKPEETKSCGSEVGECSFGTQTCQDSHQWGACVGDVGSTDEVCDNKDNNCNNEVDEDLTKSTNEKGACSVNTETCVAGVYVPNNEYTSVPEPACDNDNIDNDCDDSDAPNCINQVCENNIKEGTEVCDGSDLNSQTCKTQGFDSGNLACKSDCTGYDTSSCQNSPQQFDVTITSLGFSPNSLTIKVGETVTWTNQDTSPHWPASVIHPFHTNYPGSDINKCGTTEESTIFDACDSLSQGDSYSFTFNNAGSWEYHDHFQPGLKGTIVVQ